MRSTLLILSCLFLLLTSLITTSGFIVHKGPQLAEAEDEVGGTFYEGDPLTDTPVYDDKPALQENGATEVNNTKTPPYVLRPYSECAGGVGMVQDVEAMSDGTYRTFNQHFQSGVCGDNPQSSQPQNVVNQAPSVVRSYPECAGSPGLVRDVDAMSDGTYRTYNTHFQAGACGDVITTNQPQPQASQQSPIPITAEDYQCEGGNKVYYRVYINVARSPERTGRVDYNSYNCTSQVAPLSQIEAGFVRANNQLAYPVLAASCVASPSLAKVGEGVTWQVQPSGGSGNFNYDFSGDLVGQHSSGNSVYVPGYADLGIKQVEVKVKDQATDQKVTANCSILIVAQPSPSPVIISQPVLTPVIAQAICPAGTVEQSRSGQQIICQPTTTIVVPTPTPLAQVQINNTLVVCPVGTIEKSRSSTNLICERPSQVVTTINASNPAQCPAGTVEKSRNSGELWCEKTASNTVTILAAATTPTPVPVQTIVTTTTPQIVQCPAGTIEKSRTSRELICERQVNQAAVIAESKQITPSSLPQQSLKVLGEQASSIRELPKTGLPLAAIGFTALTPLGIKLRRKFKLPVIEESAHDIWMRRQIGS